ncbi:hypothetical protein A3C17_03540 [Candidatus Uhrbacteria bacterium RIFCSPHIGHO2_02_FULL_53_13]|uniref:Uncharacterized protein n=2 Tax=Candidatus Uhriibacteriota TaxID=1752732 RepID=A0A1F7U176_9BACT|nr:MAG: hypothetical protein A3C17_03540 [Candidatus Uhrbacteria bacterium RIFCSPHIGHO2_02_FULL_53_13]OGL89274.1 MAG: hypothetical protein A3I45_04935 [Candidatus Uhrbacteria bacterium RIFCSPLOWO2_02_FULL_53_10]
MAQGETSNTSKMPIEEPYGVDVGVCPGNSRVTRRERTVGPDGIDCGDGILWGSHTTDSERGDTAVMWDVNSSDLDF